MSSLDLSPKPGSAPFARMVRAQAVMETKLILRNGEQLLLAVVVPLLVLVGGVFGAERIGLALKEAPVDALTPGVLALVVMSTAFVSLAIATGFERRYGVLKRLGSSPLPRHGLLAAKALSITGIELLQIVIVSAVAAALGWQPDPAGILPALVTIVLATAAFAGLGLLVAGTLRAEATLAAANLIYLLLLAGGAVVIPATSYGAWGKLTTFLPSGALGEGLRHALIDGAWSPILLMVLLGWTIATTALVARTFSWE